MSSNTPAAAPKAGSAPAAGDGGGYGGAFERAMNGGIDGMTSMIRSAGQSAQGTQDGIAGGLKTERRETWSKRFYLLVVEVRALAGSSPRDLNTLRFLTDAAGVPSGLLVGSDMLQKEVQIGEVRCIWIWPATFDSPDDSPSQVLYLHGGAFCLGSPETHKQLAAVLSRNSQAAVLVPDYRRCPEHTVSDAKADALAAYSYMYEDKNDDCNAVKVGKDGCTYYCGRGIKALDGNDGCCGPHDGLQCDSCKRFQAANDAKPSDNSTNNANPQKRRIFISGESAGANIGLSLALTIRSGANSKLPEPAGLVLMSPWVDLLDALEQKNDSWKENGEIDFVIPELALLFARWVLGAQHFGGIEKPDTDDAQNQLDTLSYETFEKIAKREDVSPGLAADLSGLPPSIVLTGACETLRDSQLKLVERMKEAKVNVQNKVYPDMPHAFGLVNFAASGTCMQPSDVLTDAAEFIKSHSSETASV